eukprot:scaffold110486_cov21-Prasinocladus_malaysianus.AAC.1
MAWRWGHAHEGKAIYTWMLQLCPSTDQIAAMPAEILAFLLSIHHPTLLANYRNVLIHQMDHAHEGKRLYTRMLQLCPTAD